MARIGARGGVAFLTFTPLLGMSNVVSRFLQEESDQRHVTRMEIDEAEHISPEERERIIEGYPVHEREARARGIPMLGSGRVFPIAEEVLREELKIPNHRAKIVWPSYRLHARERVEYISRNMNLVPKWYLYR